MKYQHLFHEIFIWFSVNVYFPSINNRQIWTNPFSRASTGSRSPVISGILRCLPLFKDSLIMNICKSPLEHKNTDTEPLASPFHNMKKKREKKTKKQATGIAFNESCAFQTALVSYEITIWEAIYDSTKFLCVSMRVQSVRVMEQNEKPALLVARN